MVGMKEDAKLIAVDIWWGYSRVKVGYYEGDQFWVNKGVDE